MEVNLKHFSIDTMYAIYLLLMAIRKGVDRIQITENCIRKFLGRERLHDSTIWKLADSYRPFFPDARVIGKDLYLHVESLDDHVEETDKRTGDLKSYKLPKYFRTHWKTEVISSLPAVWEMREDLIAQQVAECIHKYGYVV